jgi:hypothetical protein
MTHRKQFATMIAAMPSYSAGLVVAGGVASVEALLAAAFFSTIRTAQIEPS